MKIFYVLMILISFVNGDMEIRQNFKALYKGIELNEYQKNYIKENELKNINTIKQEAASYINTIKEKNIRDKTVVEFWIYPNNEVKDVNFLSEAHNKEINLYTKEIIKKAVPKFEKVEEKVLMRYIIEYDFEQKNSTNHKGLNNNENRKIYQNIQIGTTRFEHSMSEQVREFETLRDEFVNVSLNPQACANVYILTDKNQKIYTAQVPWAINKEVPKGKYKLLIQTKETCNVNLQYP